MSVKLGLIALACVILGGGSASYLYGQYKDWNAVLAIATWVTTFIVALGIGFATLQIEQARKSTNAQVAVELFRELRKEETKNTLRFIYELRHNDIPNLCDAAKHQIDSVIDKFELLGALVNQGIVDKHLAIEAFAGPPALRCWYKLVDYIKEETYKRGYFIQNYEVFTRGSLDYFDKRHIKVNFYEKRADGTIISKVNLVDKLKLDSSLRPRSLKEIERKRDC